MAKNSITPRYPVVGFVICPRGLCKHHPKYYLAMTEDNYQVVLPGQRVQDVDLAELRKLGWALETTHNELQALWNTL